MFNSTSEFYRSKEWRAFREQYIAKRMSKDGGLVSDYSGKTLLHRHDVILHHKKPLTATNVNDYNISLNEENIMLVSQLEHNEIHNRFGNTFGRKVYVVAGSPCSGKTTFVNNVKGNSDLVVDMDSIWQCLTGGDRYYKPNALKTNVFAMRDTLYDMIKTRTGKWEKAWVITSESSVNAKDRLCERLGAELIEMDTTEDECIYRLYKDPAGRDVKLWERLIRQYYDMPRN